MLLRVNRFLSRIASQYFLHFWFPRTLAKRRNSWIQKRQRRLAFDIPTQPENHTLEITQSQTPLTLNLTSQHSVLFHLLNITIGVPSNSVVTGDTGQSLKELQHAELSIIRLLCVSFGCRIVTSPVRISYTPDDYRTFCFYSPQFAQFEQADTAAERNLRKSRPLFYFSDIMRNNQNGIQKWFDLEQETRVGLLSLISDIIHNDRVPLENQIEDCCSAASYLKTRARDPNGKKQSIATTIYYLAADVLGLPEAHITDPREAENNSSEAYRSYCWSKSIADYYNSLKHGDYKRETQ